MKIADVRAVVLEGLGEQGAYGAPTAALIRIETDAGIVGWGETDSHPAMVRAVVEGAFHNDMMSGLGPVLIGRDPRDTEALWTVMARAVVNIGRDGLTLACMAGVDIALWDIRARVEGVPLADLLGCARRRAMPFYATFPLGADLEETAGIARQARALGVPAAKFGWTPLGEGSAREDERIVATLREHLGSDRKLLIDGGLAFDVERAIACTAMLAQHDVYWFEEPLRPYDIEGYRALRKAAHVPIAAGELATSEAELNAMIDGECVDVLQVDLTRVGFTQGMRVAARAAARGIRCVNHTYTQDINLAASLHFVAAIESCDLVEVQFTPNEIRDVLVRDRPVVEDGLVLLPRGPGHGAVPDPAMLQRFADKGGRDARI